METLDSKNEVKAENCKLLRHDPVGTEICTKSLQEHKDESPLSCVSTMNSPAALTASQQSVSEWSEATIAASSTESQKENSQGVTGGEADSSEAPPKDEAVKPMIGVNLQPGDSVVQQDIVDMYMKSMQQFTDSLAKMKLPLDVKNSSPSADHSTDSSTTEKLSTPKGSRVFYGSRAFF